jgi:hypothetical protein
VPGALPEVDGRLVLDAEVDGVAAAVVDDVAP